MAASDVVITGIGLVSSLGEGVDAHWRALSDPGLQPHVDTERFKPYPIHPLPAIEWGRQIPGRSDQRQMENLQKTGVYAAGLALDDAGIKGDDALCASMDMIVASGGGERDDAVDRAVLAAAPSVPDAEVLLNEKLNTELRPTLFLAQLANLLAGNVSIVHKVTGSSQTFMGEETAGISALQVAITRIAAGSATHMLVGGAFSAEHPEFLLMHEIGARLLHGPWHPVGRRAGAPGGGLVLGTVGCFLVLESAAHAAARGAAAYARLGSVQAGSARRGPDYAQRLAALARAAGVPGDRPVLVVSAATGAPEATAAEQAALAAPGNLTTRAIATAFGHAKEAQFPLAVAVAAMALRNGAAPARIDPADGPDLAGAPDVALATSVGHHRGEGMVLLHAVSGTAGGAA